MLFQVGTEIRPIEHAHPTATPGGASDKLRAFLVETVNSELPHKIEYRLVRMMISVAFYVLKKCT
jgi:hypothetical protein